ncbi:MAG: hypothetical protein OXF08_03550 [Bacteroidetes bacterium]|nr:hypothetical protein [Bacteroidota bacterium]
MFQITALEMRNNVYGIKYKDKLSIDYNLIDWKQPHTDIPAQADETQTSEEESHLHIRTFREQVLKVGATIARHGRYIRFRIAQSAVEAWKRLWKHFGKLEWHELPSF